MYFHWRNSLYYFDLFSENIRTPKIQNFYNIAENFHHLRYFWIQSIIIGAEANALSKNLPFDKKIIFDLSKKYEKISET